MDATGEAKDSTTDIIASLRTARPDPERLGGKGANLARLASAGFPVPFGFVVTTDAYRAFIATHGLDEWHDGWDGDDGHWGDGYADDQFREHKGLPRAHAAEWEP